MRGKIRIGIIHLGIYPIFNDTCRHTFGGAEVQLYHIGRKLKENPLFEVTIFVGDFDQPQVEYYDGIRLIKTVRADSPHSLFLQFIRAVKLFHCLLKYDVDLFIQRTASLGTGLIAFICKLFRKKFIYMIAHDWDCNRLFEKQNNFIVRQVYRYGLKNAHSIIAQSDLQKQLLLDNYHLPAKTLPSMYPIRDLKKSDRKYYLWIARGEPWKQPEIFFELADLNPDRDFLMVCTKALGKDDYYEDIKKMAAARGNVQFFEFVPLLKIQDVFSRAILFINTSKYEGFPNTFIQAGMTKTPILSLNVDPDNFIVKKKCGFFCENDKAKMQTFLKEAYINQTALSDYGENLYSYIKDRHDIEKYIGLLEKEINTLCAE